MDYDHFSEDYTNSDSINIKTPRRSLRLKLNKSKVSTPEPASSTRKEIPENPDEKESIDAKVIGKKKKSRKSKKHAKSKSAQLTYVESDSAMNVTFDKSTISKSESEKNVEQIFTSKNVSVNENIKEEATTTSLHLIQNTVNRTLDSFSEVIKDKSEHANASEDLLSNKSEEPGDSTSNDNREHQPVCASKDASVNDNRKDAEITTSSSPLITMSRISDSLNEPLENQNELLNKSEILLNKSTHLADDVINNSLAKEQSSPRQEISVTENKKGAENSTPLLSLQNTMNRTLDSFGEAIKNQNKLTNAFMQLLSNRSENSADSAINDDHAEQQISTNTTLPVNQNINEAGNATSLFSMQTTIDSFNGQSKCQNELINISDSFLSNQSGDSDCVANCDSGIEKLSTSNSSNINVISNETISNPNPVEVNSPKTPFLNKNVEQLVSSTPIMRPINTTTLSSIKRLQSNSIKSSAFKSKSKKSIVNRVSTPFHRSSIAKKNSEPLKLITASLAENILRDGIVTNVGLKEIIEKSSMKLRSTRKRTLSDSTRNKKAFHVTFHSPSNVEIPIDAIDEAIKKTTVQESKKKEKNIYVTERRKRSLSVAETEMEKKSIFANLQANEGTPSKQKKLPVPTSRTKMPNFAAIHQQKFHKMESIADHVARKAERAKALTSSTAKHIGSSVKAVQNKSSTNKEMDTKPLKASNKTGSLSQITSKARQKIDLSHVDTDKKKVELKKAVSSDVSKPPQSNEMEMNKVKSRQQKNTELYKSRPQINERSKQKRQEIVKGVRSNRRFELQMMCRNRTDQ